MKKIFLNLKQYFKDSYLELKKVNWPTRKEALRTTLSVIFLSLMVALFLGLLDYLLLNVMRVFVIK
ncbi:MAG: preprotein translocase subunit SecE [Candidatus Paceibacterota bacterium]